MCPTSAGFRALAAAALVLAAGCGEKGAVTFVLEAPSEPRLSPLADARRDAVALFDETSNMQLGLSAGAGSDGDHVIGDLPVGTFDVRASITGGSQLLGLGRTPGAQLRPGAMQQVIIAVRKPIAYYGSARAFGGTLLPGPDPLMAYDTTLPLAPQLPPIKLTGATAATATTSDGRFIFAAAGPSLALVDTRDHSVRVTVPIEPAPGAMGNPVPVQLLLSPGDASLAIATDQGIALVDVAPLLNATGTPPGIKETKLTGVRRLAFSPDGATLAVLISPPWDQIDCTKSPAASLYRLSTKDPTNLGTATPSEPGATDINFDAQGRLLVASPCAFGVVEAGGGKVILDGRQIHNVVVAGERTLAISGELANVKVAVDPDDPTLRNVDLPAGQIAALGAGATVKFLLPPNRLTLQGVDPKQPSLQVRLIPTSLAAYDVAASPDGTRLVFANRIRYEARNYRFNGVKVGMSDLFYCTLDVVEDVYRISQVDTTSGAVTYQSTTGFQDERCVIQCYDCRFGCTPTTPDPCALASGFAPAGMSVLMGHK